MTSKATALLVQISTGDGSNRQQMVALPTKAVWKRTVSGGTRTQWRAAFPDELARWVAGYLSTAATSSPDPLTITHGLALMEVTEAEVAELATKSFPRNVGLRYTRVIDAMDTPGDVWDVTPLNEVEPWIATWLTAVASDDDTWLDRHVHPAGTAKAVTPPAPATTTPASEPAPVVDPFAATYPPIIDGFVTRPNGERYRVRMIEGKQDVMLLREARLNGDHVFLTGDPGTGKTALVEAAFGTSLVTMLGTEDTETADFVGGYVPGGKPGKYRWQDGAQAEAMERGVPLFVDEGGVISPKTMTVLYSVMDGRGELNITANPKRGTITAKPGFFVCIATNPHAPGVRISEALTSRMAITIEVTTDYSMMRTLGVPDEAVTVSENLLARRGADGGLWVPQARELLRYKAQDDRYGRNIAIRNLIASAPEEDREEVIEVVQRVTGVKYAMLTL